MISTFTLCLIGCILLGQTYGDNLVLNRLADLRSKPPVVTSEKPQNGGNTIEFSLGKLAESLDIPINNNTQF